MYCSPIVHGGDKLSRSQAMQQAILRDGCDGWVLHVVVPRAWKWSSLPDHCHRLPPVIGSDVATFRGLLDRCYQYACADVRVMRENACFLGIHSCRISSRAVR